MMAFDFDGVFTDNRVIVSQDGSEAVLCNRSDGLGLDAVRSRGVTTLVISTEVNPVVSARCKKLKLTCFQGCDDKVKVLEEQANKLGITLEDVAYLGNDINDIECLKRVGLPACVSDSHSDVTEFALYITKLPGGAGAVRELCDFIAKAKDGKLP
jgi:YrbI family 3-deoxy-D-manno-octulosonate 8-phosphate phosphatase